MCRTCSDAKENVVHGSSTIPAHGSSIQTSGNQGVFFGNIPFGGKYVRLEIFMILALNLIEGVDEEHFSCPLNFKTFKNMSKKLWPNM